MNFFRCEHTELKKKNYFHEKRSRDLRGVRKKNYYKTIFPMNIIL